MQVSVSRRAHFNAAHRLFNPEFSAQQNDEEFGKCNNFNYHGHNYELIVTVKGEIDPLTGYVYDMKKLKKIIFEEVEERYDHKNLNLDTEDFKNLNPTAENISVVIWKQLRKRIPEKLSLKVTLYETPRNFVEFDGM
jgi:6-pyruvoyltetrahydropterin/6-carboxytetrahydropterin synthase